MCIPLCLPSPLALFSLLNIARHDMKWRGIMWCCAVRQPLDPPPWLQRMREIGYPPGYLAGEDLHCAALHCAVVLKLLPHLCLLASERCEANAVPLQFSS